MKSVLLYLFIGLFFVLASCTKEEEVSEKQIKTNLIVNKKWGVISSTISPAYPFNGVKTNDYKSTWQECSLDDVYVYNADGSGYIDRGLNKCDENESRTEFIWTFNMNETATIEIYDSKNASILPIIKLSETQWILSYDFIENNTLYIVEEEYIVVE